MYAVFKALFWIFVLFLALSFFGISVQSIINSPAGQENFGYLINLLSRGWLFIMSFVQHV